MRQPVTIEGGGACAVLCPETNRTRVYFNRFFEAVVNSPEELQSYAYAWSVLAAQGQNVTGVAFALPAPTATPDEIRACFNAFLDDSNTAFGNALLQGASELARPLMPEQVDSDDPNAGRDGSAGKPMPSPISELSPANEKPPATASPISAPTDGLNSPSGTSSSPTATNKSRRSTSPGRPAATP